MNAMRQASPSWAWSLAVAAVLAVLIGAAGTVLSRRVEWIAERPPGNRVDDSFRETSRRISVLEGLWEKAVGEEATRLLGTISSERERTTGVTGVVQCSFLNPSLSDPARAHRRFDGREPGVLPVLERFAKGQPGEWAFTESVVGDPPGWVEQAGRPLAWRQGNGRIAVVLLLDPIAAAATVVRDLEKRPMLQLPADEPGAIVWQGPGGRLANSRGTVPADRKPDEILRHMSRFGDWTLQRYYPIREEVSYRMPVLAGGFALASLVLAGGIAMASWQRKAIRVAEERVSFVNRVSHELRTPLTNLLLNTDLALDGLPGEDGKLRRRLGLIREETSRLSRIVDNVLAFARIERGNHRPQAAACDLDQVLGELRENFAPLFERKSILCRFEADQAGVVAADRDALSQILSNLLSNVEKYAGEGAKARVSLIRGPSALAVEVEDDGPGVPREARQRIFLPFERGGSRVDEGTTGTGLGLAISRELAQRMGGRLDLIHTERGAKFRLEVPLS